MEDTKKAPPQPKDSALPADKIIELTPELEVISTTRGKIIDLTQVLFSPGAPAKPASPAPPKPIVSRTSSFTAKVSRQKGIESQVDAAFDFIQSKAEELRGPRVAPTPSEADLKIAAPSPIGDWDNTLVGETLPLEEVEALENESMSETEPVSEVGEKPAKPAPSPMNTAVSEALAVIETETSPLDDRKADDTLELTDVVHPVDLMPVDEMPPAAVPAEEPASAQAPAQIMELLEETPASLLETATNLLEAAIEISEDEEIIELNDIVPAEELAAAKAAEDEEEIIELNDIVSEEELAAAGYTPPAAISDQPQAKEEEIIELTDIVSEDELAAAGHPSGTAPSPAVQAEEEEEEEEIIELLDRVELPLPEETADMASELVQNPPMALPEFEPEVSTPADPGDNTEEMIMEVFAEAPPAPALEAIKPETDQVIRLDSVLSHVRKNQERISEEITLGIEAELAKEPVSRTEKFSIGIPMEEIKEALAPASTPSGEEIEAVIEKVIRSKYGQTIEQMIAKVVEKVVTREMDNIKRNLMEDQGDSDEL